MEQGLKHSVYRRSMEFSIVLLVLLAANAPAAEIGRKRIFSQPGCAWSECRSCAQYRRLCQLGDNNRGANITFLQAGTVGNAGRNRNASTPFRFLTNVSDSTAALTLPGQISKDSPFGSLEACGNFPGSLNGKNFTDSEVGPWIDVNRADSHNIVAIWQQDRWSNGGSRGNVAGVSFDGGAAWQIVPIPGLTECSGGPWERASNPWVSFGPKGTVHQMSQVFQTDPAADGVGGFGPNAMVVSKSADGGLTWSKPFTLIKDDDPRVMNNTNALTADPTDGNFVYAVWNRLQITDSEAADSQDISPDQGLVRNVGLGFAGPTYFARSTDGGETWERARKIYDPGAGSRTIGNQISVLPDGTVIDFFSELLSAETRDPNHPESGYDLSLLRSPDKGETWLPRGRPIRLASIRSNGVVTPDGGVRVRDASLRFDIAVDPTGGKLYAVWQDMRFNGVEGIAFSMSRDGGSTWSAPIKVNQTPPSDDNALRSQAFLPSIAVADNGIVAVTYYDFRNDTDSAGDELADYFAAHCESDCTDPASWGEEIRLTNASFNFLDAPLAGGPFLGDYQGLASDTPDFLPAFGVTGPTDPASIIFRRFSPHP